VYFRPCTFDFNYYGNEAYALITGGADGIGKATAKQFAKRGINLFLVDFNKTNLDNTVSQIQQEYPSVDVKATVMDLTTLTDERVFNKFKDSLSDIKIGILFNSAGVFEYKVLRYLENSHKEMNT